VEALVAELLYGSGLQLMEALRLWVQDLDFERRELTVSDGKGGKDRRTMLPVGGGEPLQAVRRLNKNDLADG
jgi:site-specific recombinase XerD